MKRSTMNLVAGLGLAALMAVFAIGMFQTSACASSFFALGAVGVAIAAVASAASLSRPPPGTTVHTRREVDGRIEDVYETDGMRTTFSAPASYAIPYTMPVPIYDREYMPNDRIEGYKVLWAVEHPRGGGIDFELNGTEFEDRPASIKALAAGTDEEITLVYEIENMHDKNAIAIWGKWKDLDGTAREAKLGYLARQRAKWISQGLLKPTLIGRLVRVVAFKEDAPSVTVRVFASKSRRH